MAFWSPDWGALVMGKALQRVLAGHFGPGLVAKHDALRARSGLRAFKGYHRNV